PELRDPDATDRVVLDVGAKLVRERLVRARPLPLCHVAARVDDEPVQPRRELRLSAELTQPHTELRERLLRRVARVLRIPQQVPRELLDPRRVTSADHLECLGVAGLRAPHENGVAQALVIERALRTQGLTDGLHGGTSLSG